VIASLQRIIPAPLVTEAIGIGPAEIARIRARTSFNAGFKYPGERALYYSERDALTLALISDLRSGHMPLADAADTAAFAVESVDVEHQVDSRPFLYARVLVSEDGQGEARVIFGSDALCDRLTQDAGIAYVVDLVAFSERVLTKLRTYLDAFLERGDRSVEDVADKIGFQEQDDE